MTLAITTALIGVVAGYGTALLKQLADRRDQLANALAEYYASSAAVFYAWQDHERYKGDPSRWEYTHKEFYDSYEVFLKNTTKLFALVPPRIGERVLGIEELWEDTTDPNDLAQEQLWFDRLDAVRYSILPLIRNRFIEPTAIGSLTRIPIRLLNSVLRNRHRA